MHRTISFFVATALLAVSLVAMVPAPPARAAVSQASIDFNGAGWGHGVGMSQYGAQARALDGQTYVEILEAYYTDNATVGTLGQGGLPSPGLLYTNVASDITSTTLTVLNGPGTPRTGMLVTHNTGGATPPSAVLNTGDTVEIVDTTATFNAIDGCSITVTIGGAETDWPDDSCDVTVALTTGGATPTNLIRATNCRRPTECTYGYGTAFQTVDNGSSQRDVLDRTSQPSGSVYQGFDLVVSTTMDEYTLGIAEVPFSWHREALKTQAVAARSFAASFNVSTDHKDMGCFCDVKNDSSYQVYAGWIGGRLLASQWDAAALATNGQVVTHNAAPDLDIVRAYYSSSNGGASEWVKEKWGGDLPYLVSVPDPWSLEDPPNGLASWTFTRSSDEVVDKIWGTSAEYTLIGAAVTARNVSGSAKTVTFTALASGDTEITKAVSVGTVTSAFGLYSWYFDIDDTRLVTPPPALSSSVGVQDPRTGIWTLRAPDGDTTSFYYGNPNDIPYAGDWNGNGQETVGLYRESTGFLFLRNTNDQGIADIDIYYGNPGDLPIAGDWNGNGVDTVGIYRRVDNTFYLRNTNTQGIADIVVPFGDSGDVPLAGDWDGDGVHSVGVYRPSTKMVYLINDVMNPTVDISFFYDGAASGDKVITGDWDDDGDDTLGVFRPSNSMWYLRDTFEQSTANVVFEFGASWMDPIAGYWGN